ncbi:MAG: pyridoxal phosphate-dependent aminotransferase [Thiogranum sp.]
MTARRLSAITPFHVMALLARARQLEAEGRSVVHMEIGEPDFVSPTPIVEAGIKALQAGYTHYTPSAGLPALREAIANDYQARFGVAIAPGRILVTPGASGALQLVIAALVDPGSRVLLTDPGYPCNRNFVYLYDGEPVAVPVDAKHDYQFDRETLEAHWTDNTVAALIASPSNPTGTALSRPRMAELFQVVRQHGGHLIVDEIYQNLYYGDKPFTALELGDDVFVINSFSKYFGMTGWRLGWLVAPEAFIEPLNILAQNLFLAAPTPAQYAALAAFRPETRRILEERREAFRARRDYLLPALQALGFVIHAEPAGAFYLYADCSRFSDDSFGFADTLLETAGVAVTPGIDFGSHNANRYLRFAYTTSLEQLQLGVARIKACTGQ